MYFSVKSILLVLMSVILTAECSSFTKGKLLFKNEFSKRSEKDTKKSWFSSLQGSSKKNKEKYEKPNDPHNLIGMHEWSLSEDMKTTRDRDVAKGHTAVFSLHTKKKQDEVSTKSAPAYDSSSSSSWKGKKSTG